jgi:sulfatase maturation enzyme AslB (radical SAM superfamily)
MSWPTARAALNLLLAGAPTNCAVELSGGEPTLEPALLRRCIAYVRAEAPPGVTVECSLTTNGTLLNDDLLTFLADHDVGLDLSFDGVPAAQELRGAGTFPTLDRLLDRARRQHSRYFARRVTVRMVVQGRTLPHLAASVRHFMKCGVRRIAIGPCMAHESCWEPGDEEILRGQVNEIVADSLAHLEAAGTVPVGFLTGADRDPRARDKGPHCAAVSGRCACVDAAGQVWGCPLFARSLRELPPLAASAAPLVSLGSVRNSALTAHLAALPERARQHPLFSAASRGCGARRCRDCEYAAGCRICPAAICESRHNLDPYAVPAFHCAFSRATLEARRRFRDLRTRSGPQKCPAELAEALRDVATALRAGASAVPTSGSGRS